MGHLVHFVSGPLLSASVSCVPEGAVVARGVVGGVAAVPAAPTGAELEHALRLTVGSDLGGMRLGVVLKEGAAALVRPPRHLIPPRGLLRLGGEHEQQHPQNGILVITAMVHAYARAR